jgi:hypothetical protein
MGLQGLEVTASSSEGLSFTIRSVAPCETAWKTVWCVPQFIEGGLERSALNMPACPANIGTCSEVTPLPLAQVLRACLSLP